MSIVHILFNSFDQLGSEWVLWILIALSIVSQGVILERYRVLKKQENVGSVLWKTQIENWMRRGEMTFSQDQISALVAKYPCLESRLLETLMSSQKNQAGLELLMSSYLGRKKVELDKNLSFLGTIGSNAPFIGLFGTVLGIIKAFHDIGTKTTAAGAQNISVGLSEALVATAVGLLVAIPAVIFFNFFQRKIKTILSRAESLGKFVISTKA